MILCMHGDTGAVDQQRFTTTVSQSQNARRSSVNEAITIGGFVRESGIFLKRERSIVSIRSSEKDRLYFNVG